MKKLIMLIMMFALVMPVYAQDKPKSTEKSYPSKPDSKPSDKALLKFLGAKDYDTREGATQELLKRAQNNEKLFTAMKKQYKTEQDPEVKARLLHIIDTIEKGRPKKPKVPAKRPTRPFDRKVPDMMKLPEQLQNMFNGKNPFSGLLPKGNQGATPDMNKMLEQLGGAKGLQDLLKQMMGGENGGDMQKMLQKLMDQFSGTQKPQQSKKPTQPKLKLRKRVYRFGIGFRSVSKELRYHLSIKEGGIYITDVIPGSYAAKNGLKPNDILVSLEGKNIKDPEDLKILKDSGRTLVLIRKGRSLKIKLPKWEIPKPKDVPKDF